MHHQSHAIGGDGVDGGGDRGRVVDHEHVPWPEIPEDVAEPVVCYSMGTHGGDQQADICPVLATVLWWHRGDQRGCHLEIERRVEEGHKTGNSCVAV
jgi:hypothetical protein